MGLFANIVSKIAASPVGKVLDYGSSILAHPIATTKDLVTGNIGAIKQQNTEFWAEPMGTQIKQIALGTATVAAAVIGVGAVSSAIKAGTALPTVAAAAKSVVGAVAKSAVAHPIQTAAAVLVGAPLVAGIITKKPELVTSLPSESFKSGGALVDAIEQHPTAAGIIGSVTGGALLYEGAKAIGLVGGSTTPTATTNNTYSTMPVTPITPTTSTPQPDATLDFTGAKPIAPAPNIPTTPINPVTQTAPKSSSGVRRRKRKSKSSPQNISQRVNVIVANKNTYQTTKKYINREIIAI